MKTTLTALAAFGGCTAARWYLERSSRRESEYLGGRVRLRSLWNSGAAFSLPIPEKTLPLLSAASLGILWTARRQNPLGAGLALGGGLSNLWERVRYGRVYDYAQFPRLPGGLSRYAFNLADLAIFGGGCLLLAGPEAGQAAFRSSPARKKARANPAAQQTAERTISPGPA